MTQLQRSMTWKDGFLLPMLTGSLCRFCSNCTDYQKRRLEIRYGQKKAMSRVKKQYCHSLKLFTYTATERDHLLHP
ncbi:hypothetical protein NC653_019777 [Populus alba x Populus x berolinensis]|uniref:Uncharacterized protein n=1 Tax=Populus alba x Populus x berolinensis TaxID=444605 RepID=A0AAD6QK02_9ROSI|nr:hypothetical protein NC653_019777 [Populus alba x Populus x berolinensis]